MPVYDFACQEHGIFTEWMSHTASLQGAPCPDCAARCAVLPALPQVSTMSSALRRAETRADASSGEPKVVKRGHLPSCGCNMCKVKAAPTSRKWMLGNC